MSMPLESSCDTVGDPADVAVGEADVEFCSCCALTSEIDEMMIARSSKVTEIECLMIDISMKLREGRGRFI